MAEQGQVSILKTVHLLKMEEFSTGSLSSEFPPPPSLSLSPSPPSLCVLMSVGLCVRVYICVLHVHWCPVD